MLTAPTVSKKTAGGAWKLVDIKFTTVSDVNINLAFTTVIILAFIRITFRAKTSFSSLNSIKNLN